MSDLLEQERVFLDKVNKLHSESADWLYVGEKEDAISKTTSGSDEPRKIATNMRWHESLAMIEKLDDAKYLTAKIGPTGSEVYIVPTYLGMHFREAEKAENEKLKSDRRHNYRVAAFTALLGMLGGALLSQPLWTLIWKIVSAFTR